MKPTQMHYNVKRTSLTDISDTKYGDISDIVTHLKQQKFAV